MKTWMVIIPFAGHMVKEVEAETESDAIKKAIDIVTIDDVEDWTAMEQFNKGNVCYCPRPWDVEAQVVDEDDE